MATHLADVEFKGYVISRRIDGGTQYAYADDTGFHWTPNKFGALWFTFRDSAEQIAAILGDEAEAITKESMTLRCKLAR